jgi:hypothetical protein
MPLTPLQIAVLRVIAANRSIGSHIAGGSALNAAADSPRFSADIDIFHDAEEAVAQSSELDVAHLKAAGYNVTPQLWQPAFRRAWIEQGDEGVKLEWAQDSAWRYFPVQSDPILGWRLHDVDLLTNKALAMGARSETRDLVDLVSHFDRFPLHAIIWAACGKDPGWTPLKLLEQMRRNSRIDAAAIVEMQAKIDPHELKSRWLASAETAEREVLKAARNGELADVCFLSPDGRFTWYDSPDAKPHRPSLGGVVPRLSGVHYPLQY